MQLAQRFRVVVFGSLYLTWLLIHSFVALVQDMYPIAVKWTEYAPRVVEEYPDLFAGKPHGLYIYYSCDFVA